MISLYEIYHCHHNIFWLREIVCQNGKVAMNYPSPRSKCNPGVRIVAFQMSLLINTIGFYTTTIPNELCYYLQRITISESTAVGRYRRKSSKCENRDTYLFKTSKINEIRQIAKKLEHITFTRIL